MLNHDILFIREHTIPISIAFNNNFMRKLRSILILLAFIINVESLTNELEIGVIEKTGNYIPNELTFYDEDGNQVKISELLTNPTLLTLVYYECPGICTPLLSEVANLINKLDIEPGKDFNIITVSFNPQDTPQLAKKKKLNYLKQLKKNISEKGWLFLTGSEENIKKLTEAVGFKYKKQGDEFIHSAVIIVLSDKGKIIRYLHGLEFLPLDIKMSIADAYEGKTAPPLLRLARLCYKYTPEGKRYVLNILPIIGIILISAVGGLFTTLLVLERKRSKKVKV